MVGPNNAPLTRGHRKKERTRRQLVEAAIDVIAEQGEAFSVSDVVARADVSNGTFYNYFTDREQLIEAVAPEVLTAFAVESAMAVAHEDPARRFATISALALARAAAEPDRVRVVLRLETVQRAVLDGEPLAHLRTDLATAAATGRFAIPTATTAAATDMVVGTLLLAARRIVADGADADYRRSIIQQLLLALGLDESEADQLATDASAEAQRLLGQD